MAARKISGLTAMSALLGTESFPLYDPAGSTAALKNKRVTLDTLRDHWRKISYPNKGSVTAASDGSITVAPYDRYGVNLSGNDYTEFSPEDPTRDTKRALLKINLGAYNRQPGIHVRCATDTSAAYPFQVEVPAPTYVNDIPRTYINSAAAYLTQAWMAISGAQIYTDDDLRGSKGDIVYPTAHPNSLGIWPDVRGCLTMRANTIYTLSQMFALGLCDAGDGLSMDGSTNWRFGLDFAGKMRWGSQPTKVGATLHWPDELAGASLEWAGGTQLTLTGTLQVSGDILVAGTLQTGNDSNIGNARLGYWTGVALSYMRLGNNALDQNTSNQYALVQGPAGDTAINSVSGQSLYLKIANAALVTLMADRLTAAVPFLPVAVADGAGVPNGSIYYSTTAGKLVFKTLAGAVEPLH